MINVASMPPYPLALNQQFGTAPLYPLTPEFSAWNERDLAGPLDMQGF